MQWKHADDRCIFHFLQSSRGLGIGKQPRVLGAESERTSDSIAGHSEHERFSLKASVQAQAGTEHLERERLNALTLDRLFGRLYSARWEQGSHFRQHIVLERLGRGLVR